MGEVWGIDGREEEYLEESSREVSVRLMVVDDTTLI